jgi:hypothetical protein
VGETKPRTSYRPRAGVTAEGELDALAAVYRFILHCPASKESGQSPAPDDATKGLSNDHAAVIMPRRP